MVSETQGLRRKQNKIGIEVELENIRYEPEVLDPYWTVETDGSLRGTHAREFKFSRPQTGERALTAIRKLTSGVYLHSDSISQRTSVHVHVDIRNMTVSQLAEMFIWYSMYEYLFFNYYAKDRVKSNFAVPVHWQRRLHKQMFKTLFDSGVEHDQRLGSSASVRRGLQIRMGVNKYSALGLKRLGDLGTVEFRHFQVPQEFSVDSFRKIIDCCLGLKSAAISSNWSPWVMKKDHIDEAGEFIFADDWEQMKQLDPDLKKTWLNYCQTIHIVEQAQEVGIGGYIVQGRNPLERRTIRTSETLSELYRRSNDLRNERATLTETQRSQWLSDSDIAALFDGDNVETGEE
jgi:hypothetical protein